MITLEKGKILNDLYLTLLSGKKIKINRQIVYIPKLKETIMKDTEGD